MSLRIKLTLFTVGFVMLATVGILIVSVNQIRQKARRDIQTSRTNELRRLQNNLQGSVSLICSAVEDQMGSPQMSKNLASIIRKLKRSANTSNANWMWVLDTGTVGDVLMLSNIKSLYPSLLPNISSLVHETRTLGNAVMETTVPLEVTSDSATFDQTRLYWYGQAITPGGWVLAAAAQLSELDSVVSSRSASVKNEIALMIKDRVVFSLFMIVACAIAIFLFSYIITAPVNHLVTLTESIVKGRKEFVGQLSISSKDEIGRLAASFNAMLDHVQESMNKLEETAGKYRELVENANSAIIHIDCGGAVIFINEYAQRLFGYSPQEVEGRNISETIGRPVDDQTSGEDMFFAPEKYPYLEREHVTRGGEKIWIGWTNRPLFDKDQKLVETLCVGSDITKSREAEERAMVQQRKLIQADKMATLGILVSGIAHEINNPNNYIVLNAQSLHAMWCDIAPVLDAYTREYPDYAVAGCAYRDLASEIPSMLKGISDGALRIKTIVLNLKDFSRTEPDDLDQAVDLAKVLDAAQIITGNLIKRSTDTFNVTIEPELPMVRGNFQRIEQVIINLLTNACQSLDAPSKSISVSATQCKERNCVVIAISDRGRGIKAIDIPHIFDPFYTTKRHEGGTGLGLAISYSIVKDHGGDLRIESVEGEGTTATLLLPVYSRKAIEIDDPPDEIGPGMAMRSAPEK